MRWVMPFIFVALLVPVSRGQAKTNGFVIDSSKPYVFIAFDHVDDRKPLSRPKSERHLWLRLVNNCRLPITVNTFALSNGGPGVGVFYDVIPVEPYAGYVTSTGEVHGLSPKNGPQGIYFSNQHVIRRVIAPGGNILFSVPANHVQPKWYIQVKFKFDLPAAMTGQQPISLLQFYWPDIPEKYREIDQSQGSR